MRTFCTTIRAIDPLDGQLKVWAGQNIPAISWADAERYCEDNGLGYLQVTGELIETIPCKDGGPDWRNKINYQNCN